MGLAEAVAAELDKITPTPETELARTLAQQVEIASGSEAAALSRELRQVLADIRRSASATADPADELKARRAKRKRA